MTRLEKRIISQIDEVNRAWNLFGEGDRLLVAVSGGKDSLALFHLLRYYPVDLHALHIKLSPLHDVSFIGRNSFCSNIEVIETEIYDKIKESKRSLNTCFLCSRQRRKRIVEYAAEKGFNKIVLGHQRNDVAETLLLNIFFSREISTLMPKQPLFQKKAEPERFEIIRPLYNVDERLIVSLIREKQWYISEPQCPEAQTSKREYIRKLLKQIQNDHPKIDLSNNIISALQAVKTDFLP